MKFLMYKELRKKFDDDQKRIRIFRKIWRRKPILRRIYFDKWDKMMAYAKKGKILEIGSGPGTFKEYCPEAILLDIVANPWIDVVGDGLNLPFKNKSIDTIIFVDVLHHMADPLYFLKEAQRILKPGGRLIMEEPYVSKIAHLVYLVHHEDCNLNCDKNDYKLASDKKALEANIAIPTVMFGRDFKRVKRKIPQLKLIHLDKYDYFFHLLYGNFSYKQLIPSFFYQPLKKLEQNLRFLKEILSFKMLVVLEKKK
jgi:SAM-dependent methyltransferase